MLVMLRGQRVIVCSNIGLIILCTRFNSDNIRLMYCMQD